MAVRRGWTPDIVIQIYEDEIVDNFEAMNFKESLLRSIYAYDLEKPLAVQQRAIIPCIKDPEGNSGAWRLYWSIALVEQMSETKCKNCRQKHHVLLLVHNGEYLTCYTEDICLQNGS
ncbi:eukaryotic initiation factor 4A-like [Lepus europaeus]|uniref:eukaryotic initiation factor 4A-like n=1 Tax=Lepus europaeus TaxID=9983 RepID=UPI002B49027E|nr:eukaryotic initiation factor 4A-like [Lepus europaeus]